MYEIDISTQEILFPTVCRLFYPNTKRESDGGFINHTIIVAKTYVLTSKTTFFQRYDSTLNTRHVNQNAVEGLYNTPLLNFIISVNCVIGNKKRVNFALFCLKS